MGSKTYALSSLTVGLVLGILVYALTESTGLGILTFVGVSVVGYFIIRAIEIGIDKGVDSATDAAVRKIQERKDKNDKEVK